MTHDAHDRVGTAISRHVFEYEHGIERRLVARHELGMVAVREVMSLPLPMPLRIHGLVAGMCAYANGKK